jgi:hypothetical protein
MSNDRNRKRLVIAAGLALGLALPVRSAFADDASFRELSAEWWQWALSIPAAESPILDETGAKCVLGQRGGTWFLAGNFGGPVVRDCSVPEGADLFLPIINAAFFDSPDTCGQGPDRIPIPVARAGLDADLDLARDVSLEIDGEPVPWKVRRARSRVFAVALPEGNLFGEGCAAGIYSPALSDGYWALIRALDVGEHTVTFHAEVPEAEFVIDVTYDLTVVPVLP